MFSNAVVPRDTWQTPPFVLLPQMNEARAGSGGLVISDTVPISQGRADSGGLGRTHHVALLCLLVKGGRTRADSGGLRADSSFCVTVPISEGRADSSSR